MNGQVARTPRFDGSDAEAPSKQAAALPPLVLDLDSALPAGFLWELALSSVRARPTALPGLILAARRGRASLERACCALPEAGLAAVPLAQGARAALDRAAEEGRAVHLLTRTHSAFAERLRQAYPAISGVVTAPAGEPIADLARTAAIRARCPGGFVVLPGEDAPWARGAAVLEADAPPDAPAAQRPALRVWAKALRLHQWVKNGLVFVPPLLAGQAGNPSAWLLAACAFLAFGLAASATYLLNDLHDLDHDRAHRSKRHRPLASGALPIPHALLAAGAGLAGCAALAAAGGASGFATVAAYLGLTLAYTFGIKRAMVLDAVTLAGLFTLRLVAGITFCAVAGSAWLLAFSMVVFTALALAKRFIEIEAAKAASKGGDAVAIAGRGYTVADGPAVMALGAGASAAAVLILALYIVEAPSHNPFYRHPELLWTSPIALFVWLGRIWVLCGRGQLRDDPVEFALTDRPSLALGLVILASFLAACFPA